MERKQNEQRGTTNREAAEDLQRGGLKQAELGNKSLKGRSRGEEDQDIHGHPKRKALSDELEDSDDNIRPAAAAGRTRSAHVTNPNKKRKRVA
jgi:hypothetical protein